jgi:hypothetical protein
LCLFAGFWCLSEWVFWSVKKNPKEIAKTGASGHQEIVSRQHPIGTSGKEPDSPVPVVNKPFWGWWRMFVIETLLTPLGSEILRQVLL